MDPRLMGEGKKGDGRPGRGRKGEGREWQGERGRRGNEGGETEGEMGRRLADGGIHRMLLTCTATCEWSGNAGTFLLNCCSGYCAASKCRPTS